MENIKNSNGHLPYDTVTNNNGKSSNNKNNKTTWPKDI
jgi:hypothetical protein